MYSMNDYKSCLHFTPTAIHIELRPTAIIFEIDSIMGTVFADYCLMLLTYSAVHKRLKSSLARKIKPLSTQIM